MAEFTAMQSKGQPYIQFLNVYRGFDELPVLIDVTFEVERGEMVVVLGRSGVGKSVTLKHILGFIQPDSGRVLVAGREVSAMRSEEHTSELQSRFGISYAVFCLKKK